MSERVQGHRRRTLTERVRAGIAERRFLVSEGIVALSLLAAWLRESYPLVLAIGAVLIAIVVAETLVDHGRDEVAEHATQH